MTPGIPANNASIKCWKIPGVAPIPAGNLLKEKVILLCQWSNMFRLL